MADWKKLLVENPPASDIASSPSSGKVLKVSSNGTGLEWADDAGGAFSDNGTLASVTDRIVTITGSSSAIPTLDINPPSSVSGTSYSRIRVQTSGRDLRFNLRNGSSTSDVMTIAHSGGVGIGTTNIGGGVIGGAKLDIYQAGSHSDGRIKSRAHDVISSIGSARGNNRFFSIGSGLEIMTNSNHPILFSTNVTAGSATPQMILDTSGRLGIGTSSPLQPLHIESNNNNSDASVIIKNANVDGTCGLSFRSGSANNITIGIEKIGNNFAINTGVGLGSGTRLLTVTPSSSVGIGTTSPSSTLDVAGDANIDTKLWLGNTHNGGQTWASMGNQGNELVIDGGSNSGLTIVTGTSNAGYINHNNYNSANYQHIKFDSANAGMFFKAGGTDNVLSLKSTGVGINTTSPTEKLHVAGNILLPLNASNTSHKLRLTGDATSEIYQYSYDAYWTTSLNHYFVSRDGFVHRNSDSSKQIFFKHDIANNHYIGSTMSDFQMLAGHSGALGFFTSGGTTRYKAIQSIYTDNNTSGLKFNTKASGTDTERMSIQSDGKVKMGTDTTTSARGFLDVKGDGHSQGFYVNAGSVGLPTDIAHSGGSGTFDIQVRNYRLGTSTGGDVSIYPKHGTNSLGLGTASYQNRIFINGSNGNVGVGTTSSTSTFDVNGTLTVNAQLRSRSGNGLYLNAQGSSGGFSHRFQQAGTDRVVIKDSSGYVGIGTTSPATNLDVNGSAYFNFGSSTRPTTNRTSFQGQNDLYQNSTLRGFLYAGANVQLGTYGNIPLHLATNNTTRMTIAGDGLVGIGTSSPVYGLDVRSTGYFATASTVDQLRLGDTTNGKVSSIRAVNDTMQFKPDGSNIKFFIGNTGKIGIGTTSPSDKLEVYGNGADSVIRIHEDAGTHKAQLHLRSGGNDVKLYQSGTDNKFHIDTESVSKAFTLATDGNVGIGTASPSAKLHILAGNDNDAIRVTGSDANYYGSLHYTNASTTTFNILNSYSANNASAIKLGFGSVSSNVNVMTLLKSGNVGIGTTAPTEKLHVEGAIQQTKIKIHNSNYQGYIDHSGDFGGGTMFIRQLGNNHDIRFQTNKGGSTTTALAIDGLTHNIGIGTESPSEKLHVGGGDILVDNGRGVRGPSGTEQIRFNTSSGVLINAGNAERMRITSAGNVGIGTSSPEEKLSINSGRIQLENQQMLTFSDIGDGNSGRVGIQGSEDSDWLRFRTDNANRMAITNGGVGIGTLSPSAKFEVQPNNSSLTDNSALGLWVKGLNGGIKIGRHSGNDGAFTHIYTDIASTDHCYIRTNDTTNGGIATDVIGGADNNPVNNQIKLQSYKQTHNISGTTVFVLDSNSRISLSNNDSGTYNTVFGHLAGNSISSANSNNVAIGHEAFRFYSHGNADYNVAIGYQSMYVGGNAIDNSANHNVAVGMQALRVCTTGSYNTALGAYAGYDLSSGTNNVLVGASSGENVQSGVNNILLGYRAGYTGTDFDGSIGIGYRALYNNTADNSVAIGYDALFSLTSGAKNIAIGYQAGFAMTTNGSNTIIGYEAFKTADIGESMNIAIGQSAGEYINNASADSNILIGVESGRGGIGALRQSIAIGNNALDATGSNNVTGAVAIGHNALTAMTLGGGNLAIGYENSKAITTGTQNTSVGTSANSNSTGSNNTTLGYQSNFYNVTGSNNVAIGSQAMQGSSGNSHSNNTSVGYQSLYSVTNGGENVAIGFRSGNNINTGDSHVLIGTASGTTLTNGRRCTVVGDESDVSASGALNQTVIGQGATGVQDNSAIIGNSACADVFMGDNGSAWSTTSDGRLKENIEEWSTGLDAINKLRIIEYNFKEDNPYKYDHKKKRQGIIAQEAIEAIPEMIKDDGEWLTANQEPMIWALVNAVKELTQKVNMLETKLNKEN